MAQDPLDKWSVPAGRDPLDKWSAPETVDPLDKWAVDSPPVTGPSTNTARLAADALKHVGKSALEIIGRPGEAVSGFVGGALKGGVGAGVERGMKAFFEPNLADSKIQESFNEVLKENDVLADHPWVRAGAGFAADVVTDPLNLLGGAGIVRRGAIKGLEKAGVASKTAKAVMGVPIGEAFAEKVAAPTARAAWKGIANVPILNKLNPHAAAKAVVGKSGVSMGDAVYLKDAAIQGMNTQSKNAINSMLNNLGLDKGELDTLVTALWDPHSTARQQVFADQKLKQGYDSVRNWFDAEHTRAVASKTMTAARPLYTARALDRGTSISDTTHQALGTLNGAEQQHLQNFFTRNIDPETGLPGQNFYNELANQPQKIKSTVTELLNDRNIMRVTPETGMRPYPMVDLRSMTFSKPVFSATGELVDSGARVSTKAPNYFPTFDWQNRELPTGSIISHPALNPGQGSAYEKIRSVPEAIQEGTELDIVKALTARASDQNRAIANRQLLETAARDFGTTSAIPGKTRTLNTRNLKMLPDDIRSLYTGTHLPIAVADEIERANQRLMEPEKVAGVLTQAFKLFKLTATTLNLPSHQSTNFVGNVSNMYAAGMPAERIVPSIAKFYRGMNPGKNGVVKIPDVVRNGQVVMSGADVLKGARKYAVFGEATNIMQEIATDQPMTEAAKMLFSGKYNPLNPDLGLYRRLRDVNAKWIEDPSKMAFFHWRLTEGDTVEKAALATKKVLFDYSELTDMEQKAKLAVPFYTWMRKNIPLQVANLLQRPAKLTHQTRLLELARNMAAEDDAIDVPKDQLPHYLQEPEIFPLPGATTPDGHAVYGRARLPLADIGLLSGDMQDVGPKLAFSLNPAIRAPLEYYLGHRLTDPEYRSITTKDVPAGLLGRTFGSLAMAHPDDKGNMRQSGIARWAQEQIPVPFGSAVRTIDSQSRDTTNMHWLMEAALRGMGIAPQGLSEETLSRARAEVTRKLNNR